MREPKNVSPTIDKHLRTVAKALTTGAPRETRTRRTLPDFDAIAWVAHRLHKVIFSIRGPLGESAESILEDVDGLLRPEVVCAFVASGSSAIQARTRGNRALVALFRGLPKVQRMLMTDLEGAFERDPAAKTRAEIVLCYPGLRALCIHRIAHELDRLGTPLIPRMLAESAHDSTGIDIHPGATIGSGFFIDHGTSVVIGETSVIGRNCTLYQGVTLGARRFDRNADGSIRRGVRRHPTLKDNVTVYANATILGGDTIIGKGSVIAAGVLVQESVPANSVVKPGRVELTVARARR